MAILHANKDNFQEITQTENTVLLDFFATWCGPCRMIAPVLEQIAEENPDLVIAKIDVDDEPELAQQFGVVSIPTLVVMKNGKFFDQAVGFRSKDQILSMVK